MRKQSKSIYEHETRLKLINAAGFLFAEKGYSSATIQEICEKAGANISAVNYHFRSKLGLYEATLEFTLLNDTDEMERDAVTDTSNPEEKLYLHILEMIESIRLTDKPEWFPQLLRREIMFPTLEFQDFSQRLIKQDFEAIKFLIKDLIPAAKPYDINACSLTLFGQVKSIAMESELVLQNLFPELIFNKKGCARIARHITDIAIAGMRSVY